MTARMGWALHTDSRLQDSDVTACELCLYVFHGILLCISLFPFLKQSRWKKVLETFSEAFQSRTSPKGRWKRGFKVGFVLLSLVTWGYWAICSINCSSQLSINWNDCFNSWESLGHELWLRSLSPSHILCSSLDSVVSSANSMLIGSNFECTRNLSLENIKEI